jgi:uncharacterized protein YegP (UPF0339 family)
MEKPRFELVPGKGDETFWHLKAANGEIVAQSEGYETREGAMRGIEAVKRGVLAALGIDPRTRLVTTAIETVEKVGGENDGELEVRDPEIRHFLSIDPDSIDELPV